MLKEQSLPESTLLDKELAVKADLCTLLSLLGKKDPGSLGEKPNLTFIKENIFPLVDRLGRDYRIELVSRPAFNPETRSKFILLENGRIYLCLCTGNEDGDFNRLSEIRRMDEVRNLRRRYGKDGRRALDFFENIVKENIVLTTLNSLGLGLPQKQRPEHSASSFSDKIKKLIPGRK